MRYFFCVLLTLSMLFSTNTYLKAQGFERNLYDLQSADLITEVGGDTFLIKSGLNQFNLIGRHGEIIEDIFHNNNQHPNDTEIGEALLDFNPYPLNNEDIVFLSHKVIASSTGKSDVLYFNYREGISKDFTIQTTIFLPESISGISAPGYTRLDEYTFLNGHFYFSATFHTLTGEAYPLLVKVNLSGQLVWAKPYLLTFSASGAISRLKAIQTTGDGRVLLAMEYADFEYYHLEVDEDGNEAGGTYFPLSVELSGLEDASKLGYWVQEDGGLIILGKPVQAGSEAWFEFDASGVLEHAFAWPWALDWDNIRERVKPAEGGFIAYYQTSFPWENNIKEQWIYKVNYAGERTWQQIYVPKYIPELTDIEVLESGNLVFAGRLIAMNTAPFPSFIYNTGYLLKLGPKGDLYGSIFEGQTFEDIDEDCGQLVEAPLGGWLVAFRSPLDTFYALSDAAGQYERPVLPGTYEALLYPPSKYWSGCPAVNGLAIEYEDTLSQNFSAQAMVDCPDLVVNISAPFLRRCFESTYTVNYCNTGTALAEDAYIEVELDSELDYTSSTLVPSTVQGQVLRFDIGDIDRGQCGEFKITVEVNCEGVLLGQAHCTTATIFPNTPCVSSSAWSGASVEVEARCEGDSVAFAIRNAGSAPTSQPVEYLVIEDQVILLEGNGGVLSEGDSLIIRLYASGATYRLEATQEPNHPGNSAPTAFVEGCAEDPSAPISLGYVTQYWEDDADQFLSIDCQENIGSYDPNDKRAYPGGVEIGGKHYIESNQRISYHIRFQNTGTDTAFTVVIKDPIDPNLDLSSLKLEASSHPYSLEITPLRELVFTFNDIKLVDSLTNEPLSHGFVSFSIDQMPNLPEGTQIDNQAAIFFDFNLPIYTNTWFHEIREDILLSKQIEEDPAPSPALLLLVSPNPVQNAARIELSEAMPEGEVQLMLYDTRGVLCQRLQYTGNVLEFKRNGLANGLYFIEACQAGKLLGRGKIVVQY